VLPLVTEPTFLPCSGGKLIKRITPSAFCSFFLFSAIPVAAQPATREVSFAVGVSQFDASGTGNAPIAGIRAATPLIGQWLLGEVSLAYASLDEQLSTTHTRVGVGEGQLQAHLPSARVLHRIFALRARPYLGLGGGWVHYFNNAAGRSATAPTVSGAVGVRMALASPLVLRGEFRLRSWKGGAGSDFVNSAAEFTAGIGYRF
jgi:hypothetical protein